MGYEINSPVKQIWLPFDYTFMSKRSGYLFSDFASDYKEKYGIDLHDLFEFSRDESTIQVVPKTGYIIGAYTTRSFEGGASTSNSIKNVSAGAQDTDQLCVFGIMLQDSGFNIAITIDTMDETKDLDTTRIVYQEV